MTATETAQAYLAAPFQPFPFALTEQLVTAGWAILADQGITDATLYSTAACLGRPSTLPSGGQLPLAGPATLQVELPELQELGDFYEAHGLTEALVPSAEVAATLPRLAAALIALAQIPPAYECVSRLVRAVQVLQPPEPDIDLGYSHPAIPFSIFVSVCADASPLSSLRVTESILHEAMHLQLTLFEGVLPLVQPQSTGTFYSPWRDELRPVRGVLHGLYVFRVVRAYYEHYLTESSVTPEVRDFVQERCQIIEEELAMLAGFEQVVDLTKAGRTLACRLLNIELT